MHPSPQPNQPTVGRTGVLAALRSLVPNRRLTLAEALRLAELQAGHLLRLQDITEGPVPEEIVSGQPRIVVEPDADLPVHAASGCSRWDDDRRCWVISVNPEEPLTRQRFTVLHEYKHILDHYNVGLTASSAKRTARFDPIEYVADYFAGCVLMPKRWLKAAYFAGVQSLAELADIFDVSPRAVEVRLAQVGIAPMPAAKPDSAPRYRRQNPPRFVLHLTRNAALQPARVTVHTEGTTHD